MKSAVKPLTALLIIIAVISTAVIAFADQENELEIPHEHEYTITAFSNGVVTYTCEDCDESYTERFADHINERGYEPLDLNSDGIVNGKDYVYLMRIRDNV